MIGGIDFKLIAGSHSALFFLFLTISLFLFLFLVQLSALQLLSDLHFVFILFPTKFLWVFSILRNTRISKFI
ncbi:hypothetical protein L2E82_13813 [Cichorium intybus]|uniref:Uncharacterized protein n=1 Tax=Cichorium intybus TaxID=13427 RepID=A0ACB9EYL3_CICIN|nr:hypothetical protein L1887_33455 [Cichorium endivia]KAI3763816.1 hypothetical protein L2E82_13813 [Cichorium intybus]